jgi:hypothetical protein
MELLVVLLSFESGAFYNTWNLHRRCFGILDLT